MRRLVIVALSALMSVNAFAQFFETEPNNTRSSPDLVLSGNIAPWAGVGILNLTPNDSDFFQIYLRAGDRLTAITFPLLDDGATPDTVMALFDATGTTALVFNDDNGVSKGSALVYTAATTGDYFLAITGWRGSSGQNLLSYYENASHSQAGVLYPCRCNTFENKRVFAFGTL
jgi:hypothetical protein